MSDTLRASYDELPYVSEPRYATHPDCLATVATLFGMRPAHPDRCRYLELGCATGGNLIGLADALPGSRFVGIDLSPRQVEEGQAVVRACGLGNVELRALSILDVDESFGTFDYVVCHGVYSWVPEAVREKILAVCRRHLAPQGVAYVSYNTYPGWHQRGLVRELLQFHVRQTAGPREQVARARAFLDFLVAAVPDQEVTYARLLREEADQLRPKGDAYVFHEHLEEENHPLYFHEFAARAAAHGLQYLEDARQHIRLANLAPEARATVREWAADRVALEQYLDFIGNRAFRRTLLCHDAVALSPDPLPGVVPGFRATALVRPTSPEPDVCSTAAVEFRGDDGQSVTTSNPLLKAALLLLCEAWPAAVAFEPLWAAAVRRAGTGAGDTRPEELAQALLDLYLSNMVVLHVYMPDFVLEPGERPLASPLARLQAATRSRVTNRLHMLIELEGVDRAVLRCLDGSRDRAALVGALADTVADGRVELRQDGRLLREPGEVRALLGQALGPTLRRLALSALLIG
jgi:methyltransferase-like protein/cyclopropane fatty-acyl-phospholipid synthase-like methyltransferase